MPLSPQDALKELKEGKFSPLYFIASEEPYYTDLVTDYISEHALKPEQREFDASLLYGKDTSLVQVLKRARRFPVGERQLIVVREAQELSDFSKKDIRKRFEHYIQDPVPSTVLVFAWKHKKFDAKTKLAKLLDQSAKLVIGKRLYEDKLPMWIQQYVKQKGFSIATPATILLTEHIGLDLSRLSKELDKLFLNFEDKIQITPEHIEKYIGISRKYNVFELQKAFAEKNQKKAWTIVGTFIKNPQDHPVIPIISSLYGFFIKILLTHEYKKRYNTVNKFELAKALGVPPFFVNDYTLAIRNYSLSKTLYIITKLQEADLCSKGIQEPSDQKGLLKELTASILS